MTFMSNRVRLLPVSERKPKIRRTVEWNTGERVHKPKKGKGSYDRKINKNETKHNSSVPN